MNRNINFAALAIAAIVGLVGGILLKSNLNPDPHTWMLVAIMVVGGLMGGVVNYFMSKVDDPQNTTLTKSVFIGVAAAFLVPLFLNMLSSDLVETSARNPFQVLVFLGFCLIAAITSKNFITTIAEKLMKAVKEAKADAAEAKQEVSEVRPKVDAMAAKETEAPPPDSADEGFESASARAAAGEGISLTGNERMVLQALANPRYTFRFLSGIAHDTQLSPHEVEDALASLKSLGLAGRTSDKTGVHFYLTTKGREALNII